MVQLCAIMTLQHFHATALRLYATLMSLCCDGSASYFYAASISRNFDCVMARRFNAVPVRFHGVGVV
jgi:hypothetical protein